MIQRKVGEQHEGKEGWKYNEGAWLLRNSTGHRKAGFEHDGKPRRKIVPRIMTWEGVKSSSTEGAQDIQDSRDNFVSNIFTL
jgi:hypothetical protein